MGGKLAHNRVVHGMKLMRDSGLPMRFRLFAFFMVFLITVMLGVMIILVASGVFKTGQKECHAFLEHELADLSDSVRRDYGALSVHGVQLASTLSHDLENRLLEFGVTPDSIQDHPELLESLLEGELDVLAAALEKARASGVFLILDATVNPWLEGAENSRAGLFIKNMEPNIVSSSFANLRLLRGPMPVARKSNMRILPQWEMEFDVGKLEDYRRVMDTAQGSGLPLSRLFYWYYGRSIANSNEGAMYCCVPLRDSGGNTFGICGFEVSAMLFKMSYSLNQARYNPLFSLFFPLEEDMLQGKGGLVAGDYLPQDLLAWQLTVLPDHPFSTYKYDSGAAYAGIHQAISLYPMDSAYQEQWLLALMMPERDLAQDISGQNNQLLLFLVVLLVISSGLSYFISRKYIQPVVGALNLIREEKLSQVPKTRIPEIDDLVKFLAEQDEVADSSSADQPSSLPMFNQFLENIETLSKAERAVFDLYLKGYTAREIAQALYLSINTIKTHNKRIYMKLNISSRKELLLYAQMLEEHQQRQSKGGSG